MQKFLFRTELNVLRFILFYLITRVVLLALLIV